VTTRGVKANSAVMHANTRITDRIIAMCLLINTTCCRHLLARSAVLLLILILPFIAFAALGGNAASVDADRVHVEGALMRIVRNDAYALHEIRHAEGAGSSPCGHRLSHLQR
jgi:hypothetical protein